MHPRQSELVGHNLRPAILDDLGLASALDHLAQEFTHNSAVPVRFGAQGSAEGLPDVVYTVLFRIAQEALTNIERHAGARNIDIRLVREGGYVTLTISDGGGFDAERVASHPQRGNAPFEYQAQARYRRAGRAVQVCGPACPL